jgi:hypothetical protein
MGEIMIENGNKGMDESLFKIEVNGSINKMLDCLLNKVA